MFTTNQDKSPTSKNDEFGRNTGQVKFKSGATFGIFTDFDATKSMHWRNPNTPTADPLVNSPSFVNFEKCFYYGDEFNATDASISPEAQAKLNDLNNEKGQLTHSVSYNDVGEPIEYRFMSYNEEGYLDWEIIQFNAGGISAPGNGPPPPPDGRELMPAPYGNTSIIDLPNYNLQGSLMTQNVDLDANDT